MLRSWAFGQKKASNAHTRAPTKMMKMMSGMDLNIRKIERIQRVAEDPEKSKPENFVPTTNVVNGILEGMGVTSRIIELRRLGKFDSDRKKPKALMLTLSTEHEARPVMAEAFERRHDLKDKGNFVLPALSKEHSRKRNLCLKKQKQRQLLNQNVPREK